MEDSTKKESSITSCLQLGEYSEHRRRDTMLVVSKDMVIVKVMKAISERNDEVAREIREQLDSLGIKAVNLISSPGSGKTTLIEKTIEHFKGVHKFAVVVGDLFTPLDGERIEAVGASAYQLNTEGSCHLTAPMIKAALEEFKLEGVNLLFIENVGNLICPSVWYLGESARVLILSVAEGSDKAEKYRSSFYKADAVVISKLDLLLACDFDLEKVSEDIRKVNKTAQIFALSAKTGEGMDAWFAYMESLIKKT